MTKLTKAQRELLGRAAEGGAEAADDTAKTAAVLIKRGLLISIPRRRGASRLVITEAGRAALGLPAQADETGVAEAQPGAVSPPASAPTPVQTTGKLGLVVALLRRPHGASIEELTDATGWQAHSVRGAIAGAVKKKLGLVVASEKTERGRVYRIEAGAGA
jgi:hypothetical protein